MGIVIRQSLKGTIVTYIGAFIGFITTMFLVTEYLEPEDIGLTKVILEVGLLFAAFAQLGTTSSALRFFPYFEDKEKNHNGFFFYLVLIPLIGCLIVIPVYLLLKEPVNLFFEKNSSLFLSYYYWVIPLIVFLVFWSVFEAYATLNMRIAVPKFVREVGVRLMLVVVYLLYGFHIISRDGFVGGYIAVYAVAMLAVLFYVSRIAPVSLKHDYSYVSKPLKKDFSKYTLFLLTSALGGSILGKLDIFMVSSQMGLDYTGIYTIAFYMATVIDIPSRSISAICMPIAASAMKNGDTREANQLYKKVSLHQLMSGGLIFTIIWINIDSIFAIIPNGNTYVLGKWVVFFIGLSKLLEMGLGFGGTLIKFSKYYYWSLFFVFIVTGLGVLTNYLLIPVLGVTGASIATLISSIISLSFQQWIVFRKIKGNPFSIGILKLFGVIVALFVINYFLPQVSNVIIDIIYRTALVGIVALVLVYLLKISTDLNGIIDGLIKRIRKRS
ncbi:polysaccharide biosynthesis protein [Paludibacter sp. 221]|uniref:oligosaccharide flippase family protein n=1 Tax=Paludibacter sp. 221 TaxID=2302939 RepID=UPI0013D5E080|nr:oligosaccharide flippase family protein [Paludibacter sp. 221]NDV47009.1 polysaccharide biosynthesis protein [Paludibacter sp. 221]